MAYIRRLGSSVKDAPNINYEALKDFEPVSAPQPKNVMASGRATSVAKAEPTTKVREPSGSRSGAVVAFNVFTWVGVGLGAIAFILAFAFHYLAIASPSFSVLYTGILCGMITLPIALFSRSLHDRIGFPVLRVCLPWIVNSIPAVYLAVRFPYHGFVGISVGAADAVVIVIIAAALIFSSTLRNAGKGGN